MTLDKATLTEKRQHCWGRAGPGKGQRSWFRSHRGCPVPTRTSRAAGWLCPSRKAASNRERRAARWRQNVILRLTERHPQADDRHGKLAALWSLAPYSGRPVSSAGLRVGFAARADWIPSPAPAVKSNSTKPCPFQMPSFTEGSLGRTATREHWTRLLLGPSQSPREKLPSGPR